jgi:hypothetical protein
VDILLLRLVHIGAGTFWVGAVFAFFLLVQPAAVAAGPSASGFIYQLLHYRRFSSIVLGSAIVTVLAGTWLLVVTSNGLDPELLFDISRLGYTVGGIAAIVTLGVGGLYVFPRTRTVERTIGDVLAEQRPPTPDEQQLLARTGRESRAAGWVVIAGLSIAVIAMATARYWSIVL